ncbi:GDSL-type esterase/lipase family protein [Brevundimonas sp. 2R-24]|uniref:GDSL-type esterase/lipase family protein n=1 Tax=Peiella sedimenti TaxID=3061083 RepID=A0ABT8SQ55_9CAUL|nr:GDSL-type esterase/lipase family protein [Caulobacteraceae bacterium XZ-24]
MIAALLALAVTMAQPPERPADCTHLCGGEALAPVARTLHDPERQRPLRILILGDSHSAADHISGALRERLQGRYGEGGRGVLPAGLAFQGYSIRQGAIEASGVRMTRTGDDGQAAGLSGFVATAQAGARLSLAVEGVAAFDELTICYLAEPGAGVLSITAGDARLEQSAAASDRAPRCVTLTPSSRAFEAAVEVSGAPVRLFSWAARRTTGGGVEVSNLGVIGALATSVLNRDAALLQAELEAYRPDLIIVAFGTNEGFEPQLDLDAYHAAYAGVLTRLASLAPQAQVVALGAPDAATVRPDLYYDGRDEAFAVCSPLTPVERADYAALVAARDPALARWYAPPMLGPVREAQRDVARSQGVPFWDWEAAMGGPCSIHQFYLADPPMARGDHVHFTRWGADLIGGRLADDLIAAFEAAREGSD